MNPTSADGSLWCPRPESGGSRLSHCLAPALLPCGRGRCRARAEVLGLPLHQEELRRCGGGGVGRGSRGAPPREGPCGIQSLRALDTPLPFHDLLKPEFMTPDSVGLPTPLCEFGLCTPFTLSTLAPSLLPGSFASRKLGQVLQSCGSVAFVASGRLALSADRLLRGGVGTGGGKTRG